MNRGSLGFLRLPVAFEATRFNEAPIHESGKCRHQMFISNVIPGFNEAPIHESGK